MATKPPVKLVDPTTDANELTITSRAAAQIEGAQADGAAAAANPVIVAGVDGSGDVQQLSVDTSGALNVITTAASVTANLEFGDTGSLAAGASADVDTADIAASTSTLKSICVAGEQPFYFEVSSVENAVATVLTGQFHGAASTTFCWQPKLDVTLSGGAAGLDAWRVSVTNNDNNKAATFHVTFEHTT